ncbi:MAG TPA: cytochrome c [Geminicoccaceae bacterium]
MLRTWILGLAAGIALAPAGGALAVDEPANIVKYRQSLMRANGGHMGTLAAIAKGEVSFTDQASGHAHAIHEMSQNVGRLFPEGTGKGEVEVETRALPKIWEEKDHFEEYVQALQEESAKLVEVSDAEPFDQAAFAQQLAALGKNGCSGCHDDFREEKD